MGTIIECPSCHRSLHVANDVLGYPLNCPACATIFEVSRNGSGEGTASRPLGEARPVGSDGEVEEERPWDQKEQRRVRRDCEPHRGVIIIIFGILGLSLGALGLPFGIAAWVMGQTDLRKIRTGEM